MADTIPKLVGGCACGSCVLMSILVMACLKTVEPGHLGLVAIFGRVNKEPLEPGIHFTMPQAVVKQFSMKTQLFEQTSMLVSKEGSKVRLEIAILFRLVPEKVYEVYTEIGENFVNVVVAPNLASEARHFMGENEAKVLYTSGRDTVQASLTAALEKTLRPRGIILEEVFLKGVELSTRLQQSIEAKAQAEQEAERMKYVIDKEHQEKQRKEIEAKGIADFQRIVSEGITPSLLKWKGIEATEGFADSQNDKVVIMGNSKDSLPVMFSGDTSELPGALPR